jgi:hypothetical protein
MNAHEMTQALAKGNLLTARQGGDVLYAERLEPYVDENGNPRPIASYGYSRQRDDQFVPVSELIVDSPSELASILVQMVPAEQWAIDTDYER